MARHRPIPPTPPTLLNLQGISLFSKKFGSVGGAGGTMAGLVLEEFRTLRCVGVKNGGCRHTQTLPLGLAGAI
jgi:hypothetical protein